MSDYFVTHGGWVVGVETRGSFIYLSAQEGASAPCIEELDRAEALLKVDAWSERGRDIRSLVSLPALFDEEKDRLCHVEDCMRLARSLEEAANRVAQA